MAVSWTPHRFTGGKLALDTANTVVLRGNARGFDRFDDPSEIARFAAAAEKLCLESDAVSKLVVRDGEAVRQTVISIRETTDALFRRAAEYGELADRALPDFLRACARGIESGVAADLRGGVAFEAALARSALDLLPAANWRRIRICGNCGWLFLDRSRNGSRQWCDMSVCGNRQKARRHYRRRRSPRIQGVGDA